MTLRDPRNIYTTKNSCKDALPCANMALKLHRHFYLFLVVTSKLSLLTIRRCSKTRKHLFQYPQGDRSGLRTPKKRISINTNHSYHQRSSPSASINWCNNKARFIFNQLYRKRWCAKLVTVKRLLHHDTITRRVTNQGKSGAFSPLAEIGPAEHQPSISMSFR